MKTSNKILIGFCAIVFLIPVLTVMSFKRKISKGQFIVESQGSQGSNFRSGTFAAYKVIKFVSPGNRLLKVNLKESDSLYYSYHILGDNDSIRISNLGDTLLVQYDGRPTEIHNQQSELRLSLKLPSLAHLVIDNADVTLDSLNAKTQTGISASITNNGCLNIGTLTKERIHENGTDEFDFPYNLQTLAVSMNNGELSLGSQTNIQQLNLDVQGPSTLAIKDGASIQETSGRISGQSSVKASWKYIKRLATLATE
ncbi:MAG: hypothetical protein EOO00_05270 [Chitinophagaceae bacterium]|nr:MAG: hypothetical protein EOO00_05270 [Chitinophagaceae bacterium]